MHDRNELVERLEKHKPHAAVNGAWTMVRTADLREAIAALSGQGQAPVGVKVKPLVWDEHGRAGDYVICETCGQGPKPFMLTRGMKIIDYFDDEEAPKPIAQADYERHILSALDLPAPEAAETANGPAPSSLSMADGVIHAAYDRDEDARAAYDALEAGRLPAPVTAGDVERAVEVGDVDEAYLEEVADGAWGDDGRIRGLARDRLAALRAAPHLAPAQGETELLDHLAGIYPGDLDGSIRAAIPSPAGTVAAGAVEALPTELNQIGMTLNFLSSVIKSGEAWTATCQREFDAAHACLSQIRAAALPASPQGERAALARIETLEAKI